MGHRVAKEYRIIISKRARKDIARIKKSATMADRKRLDRFLEEIRISPRAGAGRPEHLRYRTGEVWSRKINEKDRLVYRIFEDTISIEVESAVGHYGDK